MRNVVIDTNVIVSAALSPKGNPARVLDCIANQEDIRLIYASAILAEYEKVLSYKRLNIDADKRRRTLGLIREIGTRVEPIASAIPLPDEKDRIFYDTAQASGAILITGNIKHFPTEPLIMTPADFLKAWDNLP